MLEIRLRSLNSCYGLILIVFLLQVNIICSQEQRKDNSDSPVKGAIRKERRLITVHFIKDFLENDLPVRIPAMTGQTNDLANPSGFREHNDVNLMNVQPAEAGKTSNSDSVKKTPSTKDVKPSGIGEQHVPIAKGYVSGDGSLSFPVLKDGKRIGIRRSDGEVVLFSNSIDPATGGP